MYREPELNIDRRPLQADHTIARAIADGPADRLMLATCNLSRGAALGNRMRRRRPEVVLPIW